MHSRLLKHKTFSVRFKAVVGVNVGLALHKFIFVRDVGVSDSRALAPVGVGARLSSYHCERTFLASVSSATYAFAFEKCEGWMLMSLMLFGLGCINVCFRLLQDQGCLPGLVLFLDNVDPAVINKAVEVSNPTTSPSTASLDFVGWSAMPRYKWSTVLQAATVAYACHSSDGTSPISCRPKRSPT